MNRGDRVKVYTDAGTWTVGTIVAVRGASAVVDLDNGIEWWGSTCYIRPE